MVTKKVAGVEVEVVVEEADEEIKVEVGEHKKHSKRLLILPLRINKQVTHLRKVKRDSLSKPSRKKGVIKTGREVTNVDEASEVVMMVQVEVMLRCNTVPEIQSNQ